MKKNTFLFFLILLFSAVLISYSSCTKNFEELNTDKTRLQVLSGSELDGLFTTAQYAGLTNTDQWAGGYQLLHNLYGDAQAQFFACTQRNFPSDRNVMVGSWLDGAWGAFLSGATTLEVILQSTGPTSEKQDPVRYAVANIWKAYIYLPTTDFFGPIPYSQVGSGQKAILYDSQDSIYYDFFKILTEAATTINSNLSRGKVFESGDMIYEGDIAKWAKLGNSLRLRCAIRLSSKFPDRAKTEALAAISTPGGMILDNADNAFIKTSPPNYLNPLGVISDWGEFRMSASMQSILQGYADPRERKFFDPAANTGKFKGIRNGLTIEQMAASYNSPDDNSNVPPRFRNSGDITEPFGLMMASETWFNLAECALNGWNVGYSAKECYENGIKQSFAQWGVAASASAYLQSTKTPVPLGDTYGTTAVSDIPVAFGSTVAVQREQIGTQKWLSLYPYSSPEAWAEFRRTGFPKLLPRLNNDNPDASKDARSVKRLTYPPSEAIINRDGYNSGVQKLGGPDKTSTKLWWEP